MWRLPGTRIVTPQDGTLTIPSLEERELLDIVARRTIPSCARALPVKLRCARISLLRLLVREPDALPGLLVRGGLT